MPYETIDERVHVGRVWLTTHYADKQPQGAIKYWMASACGTTIPAGNVSTKKASTVRCGACISRLISENKLRR